MSSKRSVQLIEWLQKLDSIISEYKVSDEIARGVEYQSTRYSPLRNEQEVASKSYEGFQKGVHLTFDGKLSMQNSCKFGPTSFLRYSLK